MPPALETRQYVAEQLRGVDRENRTLDIVASDFSLDSYGTRIDPAGWELEQFKKNGPICVQHDSYTRNGLPVAQAIADTVRVDGGKLVMRIQFPPKGADETADRVFELAASGILRGVSVGFDPQEWEDATERQADGSQITVRVYKKQRLMEVSLVTIPSNDNGLVVRSRSQGADEAEVKKLTEELEEGLKHRKYTDEFVEKCVGYFERKQPANRESTKVLARFFAVRGETQPDDEVLAWKRMAELLEEPAPLTEMEKVEIKEEITAPVETQPEVPAETPAPEAPTEAPQPTPPTPVPEAPEPARTASVQIPIEVLLALSGKLGRAYADAAAEALRQGVPLKDAGDIIDGLNRTVTSSITTLYHARS
jgi:HK97 family phage prohead protease